MAIVRRISRLVHQGVSPESILAVTFTNRAAREMMDRLHTLLGATAQRVFVGTLHLLGLRIIRENTTTGFVVFNREEQVGLLRPLLQDPKIKAMDIADEISHVKSLAMDPPCSLKSVFEGDQAAMMAQKALDFDDLILKPLEMLDNPALLGQYRERFRHIIIDEYQDINPAQYRLLMLLAGTTTSICAVGDPDQAIYAFRGADVGNFLNFERDFVGATEITLGLNYRSSGNIVHASGMMIMQNTKRIIKELHATKREGARVIVASVPDERAEGEFIVREIESRIGGLSHYRLSHIANVNNFSGLSSCFSDFAVIFRTNNQAEAIEEVLSEAGIPCRTLGKDHPGKGARSHDIISSLRYYTSTIDNGNHLCEMKATELVEGFARDLRFGGDQATELTHYIKLMFGDGWAEAMAGDIIDELNLLSPADDFDPRADAVTLMTLHMAKGLEFRVVFISGVEDGFIPYRAGKSPEDAEEERRLFYVGMTRAMDELFLIHGRSRLLYGMRRPRSPSPFLSDIPEKYTKKVSLPDKKKKWNQKNNRNCSEVSLFLGPPWRDNRPSSIDFYPTLSYS
jgi:DNA helicase II / ATP-dependent DNA helicase PcrA